MVVRRRLGGFAVAVLGGFGALLSASDPGATASGTDPVAGVEVAATQRLLPTDAASVSSLTGDPGPQPPDTFVVDGDPRRLLYLRFEVPRTDAYVRSATLRLHLADDRPVRPQGVFARSATDDDWTTSTITWADRPPVDGPLLDRVVARRPDTWLELHLPRAVVTPGQPLTVVVVTPGPHALAFDATGSGAGPRLVLALDRPPPGTTVAAAGDLACAPWMPVDRHNCHHRQVSDRLVEDPELDAFLALGDLQYPSGSAQEFAEAYDPTFGRLRDRTYPAVGNHKHQTPGAAGYYGYWGERAGTPGQGWYSVDLGPWHLVALNSNCTEVGCHGTSDQVRWLRDDLRRSAARCTLAFWHHPRWSSATRPRVNRELAAMTRVLVHHGVDLLLSGHAHSYERFAPLRPDGSPSPDGIRQFVIGTGGRSVGPGHEFETPALTGSERRIAGRFGHARLVLTAGGYWWSFVSEHGRVLDAGSDRCS